MPVQADGSESTEMACNEDGEIDDVAAEDFDEDQGTVLESPGAVKRATAAQVHREAVEHTAVMRAVEKQFFEEEARVKCVFDERERRLDDVHKPKRKRGLQTMWNRVCRRLENITERQETLLKVAWTSTKAAKAMEDVHASHGVRTGCAHGVRAHGAGGAAGGRTVELASFHRVPWCRMVGVGGGDSGELAASSRNR